MEISLLSLKVSEIKEGIQVVTPSRSAPWSMMANMIATSSGVKNRAFFLSATAPLFTFTGFSKAGSSQRFSQMKAMAKPQPPVIKNRLLQPETMMITGDSR